MDAGTRAASLAAELLAFYREPALIRPGFLHGKTPMPEGPAVFRLALGRFPETLERLPPSEREQVRIAAAAFVRQVCLWERATHYQVLCLEPDATAEDVKESYRLLMALIHPDRLDADWPAGCAQRANQAYAVLSDEAERDRYDERLLRSHAGAAAESNPAALAPEPPRKTRKHRDPSGRMLARFAVVAGVVAALFVVQAWWVDGEVTPEQSLLERAIPASGRWVRDVLPDPPRFLGAVFDLSDRLAPIEQPRQMASLAAWVPAPEARAMTNAAEAPAKTVAAAEARAPLETRPPVVTVPQPQVPAPRVVAPTVAVAPAVAVAPVVAVADTASPPPLRMAQATSPAPLRAGPGAPSRDQVEELVALLVSFYDAGDSDQLVNLFDRDELGFWGRMNTRTAYGNFFGSTRERRLKIDRLEWQANGTKAQARGEALVVAEYQDGRPRLERRVPVELDIVLAGAEARLSRLVLFPLGQ